MMTRNPIVVPASLLLASCAGVQLSNVDDGHSLEYRTALPAITVNVDADCKMTSQIVTIPGAPRYMSFRAGLGKADTSVEFGPGGTIAKINSKTEGQVDDALKIANAVLGAARGPGVAAVATATMCTPATHTYLIEYVNGRPTASGPPIFEYSEAHQ